jgi:hypothetical protein
MQGCRFRRDNGFDIRLGAGTHDDTVGTDDIADRNIIGGASGSGIVIAAGATNNQIVNNYIGIGWGAPTRRSAMARAGFTSPATRIRSAAT